MALIVAALQQLGKHELLKERHGARIKPDPLGVLRRELFREHHIAHAQRRRDRLRERVQVDHVSALGEREHRFLRLGRDRKFRREIVLNDIPPRLGSPADILAPLGRGRGDIARIAAVGRNMQHGGARGGERVAADAVRAERQKLERSAVRTVNERDLFIRRILRRVDARRAEKLHDQSVEIFRAGADEDLLRLHADAAAAREIARDRLPQRIAAVVRAFFQKLLAVLADDAAHHPREHRKRKVRPLPRRDSRRSYRRARHKAVRIVELHIVPAAAARFEIPFVRQQRVSVLYRDDAQPLLLGQLPLGRHPRAEGIIAADDLAAQALIQAQIRRAVFVVLFHLVLLFSPSLDILIYPEHCKLWVRKKQGEIYP